MRRTERRPTVLMIGPLPPPFGGQSVLVSNLLQSRLAERFQYVVMNVAHESAGVARAALTVLFAFQLSMRLAFHPSIGLVHIHTSAGMAFFEKSAFAALSKLFGKRVLLHIHGGRFRSVWNDASSFKKRLIRRLLLLNDALIVLGTGWKSFYRDEVGCDCTIAVLPNAVKSPFIQSSRDPNVVTLLYAGQLRPEKGLVELAEAMRRLSVQSRQVIHLRMMGKGDTARSEESVREAFAAAELQNVEFLGTLSGDEKWRQFSSADIFVLPSHSEDMPVSILEAMGVGLPVIATEVGSIPEAIDHGINGFLVKPHDAAGLADAIQLLAEDHRLRASMGAAASNKSKELFSFERYLDRLEHLYLAILEKDHSRR
jgi:glycosyltransferase involved in cell wall biosynthesis